jgi:ferritin-like metal-binding protein YciE
MFEHFEKPQELFAYRLASAMTMENDSLQMLADLEQAASSEEVKEMFRHHAGETRQQIENLEEVARVLHLELSEEPSPTTKGLAKEGRALLHKADPALRDDVAVSVALGTEHHEIAVYQSLVATARTLQASQVVHLLSANLDQEQHTSEELVAKAKELADARA